MRVKFHGDRFSGEFIVKFSGEFSGEFSGGGKPKNWR